MRLLVIAESYLPDYGGGAAIYIQDVCRVMAECGHQVRVLCTGITEGSSYTMRTDFDGDIQIDRVNLPYFRREDPDGWGLSIAAWRRHQKRIAAIIREQLGAFKPDIVHYNASRPFGEECLIEIHKQGIPLVAMFHEAWLICPRLMLLRSPTSQACEGPSPLRCLQCMYSYYDGSQARAMLKLPWRVIKLGPLPAYRLWRRSVARRGVSGRVGYSKFMSAVHQPHLPGKVSYIPLGINLTNLPDRPALRPRTPLRFGFVAGFQLSKGIWHVLDAVKSLKQIGLEFELHIWGPGQESNQHAITSRDIDDRVRLRGMYAPDEKWQVYNEIDVAIMATTVCEPLGRVPLEAAAVGAPTIAPAIGGITETIEDGVDGLLYRFQDPKDLERQMRRVLEEPSLFQSLVAGLKPVPDTRTRAVEVEKFYFEILGQLPQQNACPSA